MALKVRIKEGMLDAMSRLTGRHAVLLPAEAEREDAIFGLRAPYRLEGQKLTIELLEKTQGQITATLLGYEGHFPTKEIWSSPELDYRGPCELTFNVSDGSVTLVGREIGRVPLSLLTRRFCWKFKLQGPAGQRRERITGHYLALNGQKADESYYQGDNYVDHEAQSAGEHEEVLRLLKRHHKGGPVLEVGCATGGLLAKLDESGLDSIGFDISEWAVARAAERLGSGRAWVCDVENDDLPAEATAKGPFGSIVLWAVFEHFKEPFKVLSKLSAFTSPGTTLLINTTNADSLTHTLFQRQWEGYFDWTHYGVDHVSVRSLSEKLPPLGWRIEHLSTHLAWDGSADPTRVTIREWYGADARFRRLLAERDLGDLVICVATKE